MTSSHRITPQRFTSCVRDRTTQPQLSFSQHCLIYLQACVVFGIFVLSQIGKMRQEKIILAVKESETKLPVSHAGSMHVMQYMHKHVHTGMPLQRLHGGLSTTELESIKLHSIYVDVHARECCRPFSLHYHGYRVAATSAGVSQECRSDNAVYLTLPASTLAAETIIRFVLYTIYSHFNTHRINDRTKTAHSKPHITSQHQTSLKIIRFLRFLQHHSDPVIAACTRMRAVKT